MAQTDQEIILKFWEGGKPAKERYARRCREKFEQAGLEEVKKFLALTLSLIKAKDQAIRDDAFCGAGKELKEEKAYQLWVREVLEGRAGAPFDAWPVRCAAADMAARIGSEEDLEIILKIAGKKIPLMTKGSDPEYDGKQSLRISCILTLGFNFPDMEKATELLIQIAEDEKEVGVYRGEAITALSHFCIGKKVEDALQRVIDSKHPVLREYAEIALEKIRENSALKKGDMKGAHEARNKRQRLRAHAVFAS